MTDKMYMQCGVWRWRRDWRPAEVDRLERSFAAGDTDAQIGRRLRRSAVSIQHKRLTLGLRRNAGVQAWPPARLAQARKLRAAGLSSSEISRELGGKVTRNMVIGALYREDQRRVP